MRLALHRENNICDIRGITSPSWKILNFNPRVYATRVATPAEFLARRLYDFEKCRHEIFSLKRRRRYTRDYQRTLFIPHLPVFSTFLHAVPARLSPSALLPAALTLAYLFYPGIMRARSYEDLVHG